MTATWEISTNQAKFHHFALKRTEPNRKAPALRLQCYRLALKRIASVTQRAVFPRSCQDVTSEAGNGQLCIFALSGREAVPSGPARSRYEGLTVGISPRHFAAAVTKVVDRDVQVSVVAWRAIITSRQAISHEGEKAEDNRATTPPTTNPKGKLLL